MRRLSRTVPAFTFTMLVAASLAYAQSASNVRPPAWAKVCGKGTKTSKNVEGGEEKTDVSMCVTSYMHIDGKGTLITGAALREINGQDKKHLLVHTPPDTQVRPATHAQLLPRDLWDSLQKPGKLVKSEEDSIKELTFASTSCNAFACAAELEATPALISELEAGGGLVVFVTNPSGMTVARPIPLIGFAQALAGPSAEARACERPDTPMQCVGRNSLRCW
jgi:invasion protein IalB